MAVGNENKDQKATDLGGLGDIDFSAGSVAPQPDLPMQEQEEDRWKLTKEELLSDVVGQTGVAPETLETFTEEQAKESVRKFGGVPKVGVDPFGDLKKIKSTLRSDKVPFTQKLGLVESEVKKLEDTLNVYSWKKEMYSPIIDVFRDSEQRKSFYNDVIAPLQFDEQGNFKLTNEKERLKNAAASRVIGETIDVLEDQADDLEELGVYPDKDQYFNDPKVKEYLKNVRDITARIVDTQYEYITDLMPDGQRRFNDKKLLKALEGDAQYEALTSNFDTDFIQARKGIRDMKREKMKEAWTPAAFMALSETSYQLSDWYDNVRNVLQKNNVGEFGEFSSVITEEATDFNPTRYGTLYRDISNTITKNPAEVVETVGLLASMFTPAAPVAWPALAGKASRYARIFSNAQRFSRPWDFVSDLLKTRPINAIKGLENSNDILRAITKQAPVRSSIRSVGGASKEIANNLAINAQINAVIGDMETETALQDFAIDAAIGGLSPFFNRSRLTNVIDDVFRQGANTAKGYQQRLDYLNKNLGLWLASLDDVKTREGVEKVIRNFSESVYTDENKLKSFIVSNIGNKIEEGKGAFGKIKFYEGLADTYDIMKLGDKTISEMFGKPVEDLKNLITEYRQSPSGELLDQIKQKNLDILKSFSPETYAKVFNQRRIAEVDDAFVNLIADSAKKLYGISSEGAYLFAVSKFTNPDATFDSLINVVEKVSPKDAMKMRNVAEEADDFNQIMQARNGLLNDLDDIVLWKQAEQEIPSTRGEIIFDTVVEDPVLGQIIPSQISSKITKWYSKKGAKKIKEALGDIIDILVVRNVDEKQVRKSIGEVIKKFSDNFYKNASNGKKAKMFAGTKKMLSEKWVGAFAGYLTPALKKILGENIVLDQKTFDKFVKNVFPKIMKDALLVDDETFKALIPMLKSLGVEKEIFELRKVYNDFFDVGLALNKTNLGLMNKWAIASNIYAWTKLTDLVWEVGVEARKKVQEIEKLVNATSKTNFSDFQKKLISGIRADEDILIQPLNDAVNEILIAKQNGKAPNLSPIYFTKEGKELLSQVFTNDEFLSEYLKAFEEMKGKVRFSLASILPMLEQGKTSMIVNGVEINLRDMLSSMPQRFSEGQANFRGRGWQVYFWPLRMTKYMSSFDGFTPRYSKFIGEYLTKKMQNASGRQTELNVQEFLSKSGKSDYTSLYQSVYTKTLEKLSGIKVGDQALSQSVITDMSHPIIYNPEEYFWGVRDTIQNFEGKGDALIDEVADLWAKKLSSNYALTVGNKSEIAWELRNFSRGIEGNFRGFGNFSNERNVFSYQLNKAFTDYARNNDLPLQFTEKQIEDFLFSIGGNFLSAKTAGGTFDSAGVYLSKIVEYVWGVNPAKVEEVQGKILEIIAKSGKTKTINEAISKLDELKEFLKKEKMYSDGLDPVFDNFVEAVRDADKKVILQSNIDDMMNELKQETFKVFDEVEDTRDLEEIALDTERSQSVRQKIKALMTQNVENQVRSEVFQYSRFTNSFDDTIRMLETSGMDEAQIKTFFGQMGYSPKAVDQIVEKKGRGVLDPKEVVNAVTNMVAKGDVSFREAFQRSPDLRNAVNDAFGESLAFSKERKFEVKNGRIRIRDIEMERNWFYDMFLNMSQRAEGSQVAEDFFQEVMNGKRRSVKPTVNIGSLAGVERTSLERYALAMRNEVNKWLAKNKTALSVEDAKEVAEKVFGDAGKTFDDNLFSGDPVKKELYEMLFAYKDDIQKTGLKQVFSPAPFRDATNLNQFANALAGSRVYLPKDTLEKISQTNLLTPWNIRNLINGQFYSVSKLRRALQIPERIQRRIWFNIGQYGKFFQNYLTNINQARGYARLASYDTAAFDEFARFMDSQFDIKEILRRGQRFEIDPFASDVPLSTKMGAVIDSLKLYTDGLFLADMASAPDVLKGVLIQSLFDRYTYLGAKGVEDFFTESTNMLRYMDENGLRPYDMFNKDTALGKLQQLGKTDAEAVRMYDKMANFYKGQYVGFVNKMNMNISSFYVTNKYKELNYIQGTDSTIGRFIFPLKRWAFSKGTEYIYRLNSEFVRNGASRTLSAIARGESKAFNELANSFFFNAKTMYNIHKASGDELWFGDLMTYFSVPLAGAMMVFGEPVERSAKVGAFSYEAAREGGGSRAASFGYAFTESLLELTKEFFGTSFLPQEAILGTVVSTFKTLNEVSDKDTEPLQYLQDLFWNVFKSVFLRSYVKHFGETTRGEFIISPNQDTVGSFASLSLNVPSKSMQKRWRDNERAYLTSRAAGLNVGGAFDAFMNDSIGLSVGMTSTDVGYILNTAETYLEEKGVTIVFDQDPDKKKLSKFFDEYQVADMYYSLVNGTLPTTPEAQKEVLAFRKKYEDSKEVDQVDVFSTATKINPTFNSAVLSDVISIMRGTKSGYPRDLQEAEFKTLAQNSEEYQELENQFESFILKHSNKKQITQNEFEKFIDGISSQGTNIALADILSAANSGIRKAALKEAGLDASRYDENLGIYDIGGEKVADRVLAASAIYHEYAKQLMTIARPVIGDNGAVGKNLMVNYLNKAPDSPVQGIDGRARIAFEQRMLRDILLEDGMAGDDYMSAQNATLQGAMAQMRNADLTDEQKIGAARTFTNILSEMADGIDTNEWPSSTKAIQKMGLARPFVNEFDLLTFGMEGEELNNFLTETGLGEGITQLTNRLLDTLPMETEEAMRYASGLSRPGWPGGVRYQADPQRAEYFAKARNDLVDLAVRLGRAGFDIPSVQYRTRITKAPIFTVEIENVTIEAPRISQRGESRGSQTRGTRKVDLTVWKPKRGVSSTSRRFRPPAIKIAKKDRR